MTTLFPLTAAGRGGAFRRIALKDVSTPETEHPDLENLRGRGVLGSVWGGGHQYEWKETRRARPAPRSSGEGDVDDALASGVDGLPDDRVAFAGGGGLAVRSCCDVRAGGDCSGRFDTDDA